MQFARKRDCFSYLRLQLAIDKKKPTSPNIARSDIV